jgi:hypothetical protein
VTALDEITTLHPSQTPGALEVHVQRWIGDGDGMIEFEFAPFGWLAQNGELRQKDHRAYYWTVDGTCLDCNGSGRVPSEKRPEGTIKCKACNGTGDPKRRRMVSVTTLLDAITPKGGLPRWAEARGIEGTVLAYQRGLIEPDAFPEDAVEIVRGAKLGADSARDTAATRGLNIHSLLEQYMLTGNGPSMGEHPHEHHGYIQALCAWLLARDPQPESVEQVVCSPTHGYAGRRDLIARVDGKRIGWDAKTQENGGIYLSAHLQNRLYEDAAVEIGDEPCDELAIVVFAANGKFREMPGMASSQTARAALAYYEWIKPIDSACESLNRIEKNARKAVVA